MFGQLRDEHLLSTVDDDGVFLDRLAYFYAEVNALHPFREGNGRAQRAFSRQLALHAGRRVDFGLLDPAEYNEACRVSMVGSTDALRRLFALALVPGAYGWSARGRTRVLGRTAEGMPRRRLSDRCPRTRSAPSFEA